MFNGFEKAIGIFSLPALWIASIEVRLKNKVSKDRFTDLKEQNDRLESHLWDLMQAQHVTPTIAVPEEIKNNDHNR